MRINNIGSTGSFGHGYLCLNAIYDKVKGLAWVN